MEPGQGPLKSHKQVLMCVHFENPKSPRLFSQSPACSSPSVLSSQPVVLHLAPKRRFMGAQPGTLFLSHHTLSISRHPLLLIQWSPPRPCPGLQFPQASGPHTELPARHLLLVTYKPFDCYVSNTDHIVKAFITPHTRLPSGSPSQRMVLLVAQTDVCPS